MPRICPCGLGQLRPVRRLVNRKPLFRIILVCLMFYVIWSFIIRGPELDKCSSLTCAKCKFTNLIDKEGKRIPVSGPLSEKYHYIILDHSGYTTVDTNEFIVDNCLVTRNRSLEYKAHAVAITSRKLWKIENLPKTRTPWQRWIWIMDESPNHAMQTSVQNFGLADLNHRFNWTMTYKPDSDIHIPYAWTFKQQTTAELPVHLGKQDRLVAIAVSNCGSKSFLHNNRMEYVSELQKSVEVTIYGKCGIPCPGYVKYQPYQPCAELRKYLFYLAFENSNCRYYISEKMFFNALNIGVVPVVMGPPREDYESLAPPNSFIHVGDFESPEKLANYLIHLSKNTQEYMRYHDWRKDYAVKSRIQFIHRAVWCPLCKKLNADNRETKIITNLPDYWSVEKDCTNGVMRPEG